MKNKKVIGIITIIFLIFIFGCVFYTINQENEYEENNSKEKIDYTKSECINKGSVCSLEEIKKGIKISYDVNDKEKYDFYVIANDENNMTLISAKSLAYSNWNMEEINMKGPVTPLFNLYDVTSNWDNVQTIDNYVYSDYGYRNCLQNESDEEKEFCKEGGYHKIQFGKNSSYVETNIIEEDHYQNYDLGDTKFKARLITVEEVLELDMPLWLSDNLKDGQGYWTMSSSTAPNAYFVSGAYGIMYLDGKTAIESLHVEENTIGLKAVINVLKK